MRRTKLNLARMKRPRPQDARRDLRTLWSSVAVYSCADGTLRIEPTWRKRFRRPGMLTRMHSAYLMENVLRLPKKRINWMTIIAVPQKSSSA